MRLSVADAGPVRVRVGDTLELALPETAATGYRWRFTSGLPVLINEYVAAPDAPDAAGPSGPPGPPGRSGERRVVFGVTAAGTHELRAELARPWENAPRDTIVFVVEAGS